MTVRNLVVGALSVAVCLTVFAASDQASAARKAKRPAGPCVIVKPPVCNLFLHPVCIRKTGCGGCLKWACRPY